MAKLNKLTQLAVRAAKPGMHGDGGGLWLQVTAGKDGLRKSWLFRFQVAGRERQMGLGPLSVVTLAEARERAAEARKLRSDGIDPIEQRNAQRVSESVASAKAMTFKQCSESYIASHSRGWSSAKHAEQWVTTLATYAYPVFGDLPIAAIDTGLVMRAIEPIWSTKPETAGRVRGRIESVLDWAKVRGYRDGENPARWKGHLDQLLPQRGKVRKVKHHAAMPYAELPAFMVAVRARPATAARALEFAILTAARTGEVLGARWQEIDLEARIWTVPAERMKAGREHRVPLSDAALAILHAIYRTGDLVFPLSHMALFRFLRQMERGEITAHGFRSTFRDWASEETSHSRDVVEMALAHAIADKTEAAYRRGDLFDKRRRLMTEWEAYCGAPPTK